jgi:hypothetical protein
VIKSGTIGWAGNVACLGERRGAYRISVGKTEAKSYFEDLDVDGMIMLKLILEKQEETSGMVFEIAQ